MDKGWEQGDGIGAGKELASDNHHGHTLSHSKHRGSTIVRLGSSLVLLCGSILQVPIFWEFAPLLHEDS